LLDDGLLNVNSSAVDFGDWVAADEPVGAVLFLEADEAEAAGLAVVDVLKDDGVGDLSELSEVLLEFLVREFEVQAAHEDFGLGVAELDGVLLVRFANHVRVRLLDLLAAGGDDGLAALVRQQTVRAYQALLVVVRGLHIHAFVLDEVAGLLVLGQNRELRLDGLRLVRQGHKDKAKASAPPGGLVAHYNCVFHQAELTEVGGHVLLVGLEGEAANKELDLVCCGWLMELGLRRHTKQGRHPHEAHTGEGPEHGVLQEHKLHLLGREGLGHGEEGCVEGGHLLNIITLLRLTS
jgi:hypothetical protein